MIVTRRLNARRSNSLSLSLPLPLSLSLSPEHRCALDLVIAFAAWKSSFADGVASLPNDLHIPTTILRYGSIIERRIIADFPRKRMEAHELLSPRLVEGDDPASSNPRTNFILPFDDPRTVYRQTFEIPPPSLLFRNEPFYYRVHCSLLLESPLPAILRTSTRVISFFLLFFKREYIYMYIEFVDHRPRSTTPSADTKLKTSTKVFTFYLCVFRCVIILASDPNTLLPSLHPLVTTHLRVPMPYRCRFFLPTIWITRARTTIERDPESGKSCEEKKKEEEEERKV